MQTTKRFIAILVMAFLAVPPAPAREPRRNTPINTTALDVLITIQQQQVRFTALAAVEEMWAQIFDQTGELAYDSGLVTGPELNWTLQDANGGAIKSGLYAYRLALKEPGAEAAQAQRGHFVLDRSQDREAGVDRLWVTDQNADGAGATIAGGEPALASANEDTVAAALAPWNSALFPLINGKYHIQTASFAGRDWRLDDFSYVGYYLGQRTLGQVPCKVIRITHGGDISAEVQQAVNALGGAGGIVAIPPGSYTMSSAVSIPFDNISIEGAGSARTHIDVPANYDSHETSNMAEALFTFGRPLNSQNRGWVDKGPVLSTVSKVAPRGALFVNADNASGIQVGDWIVLQQLFWQGLVDANSKNPDKWPANSTKGDSIFSFSYLRRVTAKQGNRVFLDAPIPFTLDPANNSIVIRLTDGRMRENVGLKGVNIHFENNLDPSTGRPHGAVAYFEGVRNGWVYDVTAQNFPRYGVYANYSARITFLDSKVDGAQDKGGLGYGYGFLESGSQNILMRRCHGLNTRHNFITSRSLTSMVVMTRCVSENETAPDDTHYAFEQAVLWDKHTQLNGAGLEGFNRGDESNGAYETLASGVIWNFYGDGQKGRLPHGGAIYLKPSPNGEAIVVGVNGNHRVYDDSKGNTVSPFVPGQLMPAFAGLQVGTDLGALHNVLYEGLYRPFLQPESLYETQLVNRIGAPPPDWGHKCLP